MEDFAKVLVVGLFIFALALVVFGQLPEDTKEDKKTIDEDTIYSTDALGDIGLITSRTRTIPLGTFSVGYTLGKSNGYSESKAKIENGWFKKTSKRITFSGDDADKAIIEFDVIDMNNYGNLSIYLNEEKIYSNITYSRQFVLIVEDLKSQNELVISATSSGPRF